MKKSTIVTAVALSAILGPIGSSGAAETGNAKPNLLDSNNYACAGFGEHRVNTQTTVMLVHFGVQFNDKNLVVKFLDKSDNAGKSITQTYPIKAPSDARMLTFGLPNQKEAMDGIMFNFIELGTLVPDANSRARFSFFLMGTNVPAQQSRFDAIDGTCIPSSMLTR